MRPSSPSGESRHPRLIAQSLQHYSWCPRRLFIYISLSLTHFLRLSFCLPLHIIYLSSLLLLMLARRLQSPGGYVSGEPPEADSRRPNSYAVTRFMIPADIKFRFHASWKRGRRWDTDHGTTGNRRQQRQQPALIIGGISSCRWYQL